MPVESGTTTPDPDPATHMPCGVASKPPPLKRKRKFRAVRADSRAQTSRRLWGPEAGAEAELIEWARRILSGISHTEQGSQIVKPWSFGLGSQSTTVYPWESLKPRRRFLAPPRPLLTQPGMPSAFSPWSARD